MKRATIFFVILLLIFSPISFSTLSLHSQESNNEIINGYQEWTQNKTINGTLKVNFGATLVIRNGTTVTFNRGNMDIDGTVVVGGTKKDPVIFKKDGSFNYFININQDARLMMRNVDISGAGFGINSVHNNIFLNAALAGYAIGGINVIGGWLNVQNCNFHDNNTPINVEEAIPDRVKVNRSKFVNNENFDVYSPGDFGKTMDFQYNWWGSKNGPPKYCYSSGGCYYEKFEGEVNFSNWLSSESFHDPVIIIPGILGSQKKDGKWQIDPIAHTYDNLYGEFISNGYVPEKDLFKFPYEWRDSNVENAKLLKVKIQEIKEEAKWPKVDIVAHSMGGLLAREYIESGYYQDDVDQLITIGTPHNGAPEAYLKWDGNEWFWSVRDLYAKHILDQEAEEQGYSDGFDYIHQRPILSLKELLPVYDYLQEVENNYQYKAYPNNYPRNEFLEDINSGAKKERLNNVEFDKIIGNVENENSTISGFKVVDVDMEKYWIHGYPLGFEIIIGDRGLLKNYGDRTVPLESARSNNISADYSLELNSVHGDLPTDAQKDILELLTGTRPNMEVNDSHVKDIFLALVYSPVDIQIIAPDGKRVGKNFATGGEYNEISGAYYSGFDTDNEFLAIPSPIDGEYKILTEGTGNGIYKIEVAKIFEDENNPGKALESTAEISGTATIGNQKELKVEVAGDEIISNQDKTPPMINIISPKNRTYQNSDIVEIKYDISDDKSQSDKIIKEVNYDGQAINKNNVDLSLEHLGVHNIAVSATDEAGNFGENKIEFTNDTNINSIISNINHYYDLHLITSINAKKYLQTKLQIVKGELQIIDILQKTKLLKAAKEKLLQTFKKMVNLEIGFLVSQIQKEGSLSKTINPEVRELLAESLESIKL